MEKNRNSMETAVKPTIQERLRIFMQYPSQKIEWREHSGTSLLDIIGFSTKEATESIYFLMGKITRPELLHTSILVKPLMGISDEDLLETCLVGITPPISVREKGQILKNKEHIVKSFLDIDTNRLVPIRVAFNYQDILREKGYALPYKNWSVAQLVEFGIYKLIT